MAVRAFQKCAWVPPGCTLPSWGSWLARSLCPELQDLALPPGDTDRLYFVCSTAWRNKEN